MQTVRVYNLDLSMRSIYMKHLEIYQDLLYMYRSMRSPRILPKPQIRQTKQYLQTTPLFHPQSKAPGLLVPS